MSLTLELASLNFHLEMQSLRIVLHSTRDDYKNLFGNLFGEAY